MTTDDAHEVPADSEADHANEFLEDDGVIGEDGRRPLGADLIIPVSGLLFGIYYVTTVWSLPWQASAVGISLMAAMTVTGIILGNRFLKQYRSGSADLSFGDLFGRTRGVVARRLGLAALTCIFVYAMPYLGFTISLFLFVIATVLMLAGFERIRIAFLLASGMSIGGYLLFIVLVQARFPHGPFERIAGTIFQG